MDRVSNFFVFAIGFFPLRRLDPASSSMDLLELENPWQHRPSALRRGLHVPWGDSPQVGIDSE